MTFVVAHRAGNDLARLVQAEHLGVDVVEADVRLWRGRAEVRHLKTVGPLPIFWDRWVLANPLTPRLKLPELFAAASPGTELLLDLKGRDRRLAALVSEALPPGRAVTICARSARLLEPFAGRAGVRLLRSVGSRRQLRALLARFDSFAFDGVSIHARLLDADIVAALREHAALVMTWPVNSVAGARRLAALGVDGLISDRPALLLDAA